jgi:hypothetical protein
LSVTDSFTLNNKSIVSDNDRLKFNSNSLAFTDDLLKIEVLSQADYDIKESNKELNEKTYYYTYDTETYLVTKETFDYLVKKVDRLEGLITELQK